MPVSESMAKMAQEKFFREYYDPAYTKGCKISLVGLCDTLAMGDERRDYCLVVRLRTRPPFKIPQKLDGVQIYVRIVDWIEPLNP